MPGIINPTNLSLYSNPTSITTPRTSRWNTQFLLEEDLNMISHPVSSNNPGIVLLEDGTSGNRNVSLHKKKSFSLLYLDRYYESATTADNADDLERQHQQQCIISSRDHHLISSAMDHHHHHSHHHSNSSHHTTHISQEDNGGEPGSIKKSEVI